MAVTEEFDSLEAFGGLFVELEQQFKSADYAKDLEKQHPKLQDDHAGYFASAKDAAGSPWPPLAPATVKRKGHATILVETGALKASLTGKTADTIQRTTHRGLHFGTADFKAPYHQSGTSHMPARPSVGLTEERLSQICEDVADATVERLKLKVG